MARSNQEAYQGPERRKWIRISASEREAILREAARKTEALMVEATRGLPERVRDLVWQDINVQVGKVAIRVVLYVGGAATLAALAWLGVHEKIGG